MSQRARRNIDHLMRARYYRAKTRNKHETMQLDKLSNIMDRRTIFELEGQFRTTKETVEAYRDCRTTTGHAPSALKPDKEELQDCLNEMKQYTDPWQYFSRHTVESWTEHAEIRRRRQREMMDRPHTTQSVPARPDTKMLRHMYLRQTIRPKTAAAILLQRAKDEGDQRRMVNIYKPRPATTSPCLARKQRNEQPRPFLSAQAPRKIMSPNMPAQEERPVTTDPGVQTFDESPEKNLTPEKKALCEKFDFSQNYIPSQRLVDYIKRQQQVKQQQSAAESLKCPRSPSQRTTRSPSVIDTIEEEALVDSSLPKASVAFQLKTKNIKEGRHISLNTKKSVQGNPSKKGHKGKANNRKTAHNVSNASEGDTSDKESYKFLAHPHLVDREGKTQNKMGESLKPSMKKPVSQTVTSTDAINSQNKTISKSGEKTLPPKTDDSLQTETENNNHTINDNVPTKPKKSAFVQEIFSSDEEDSPKNETSETDGSDYRPTSSKPSSGLLRRGKKKNKGSSSPTIFTNTILSKDDDKDILEINLSALSNPSFLASLTLEQHEALQKKLENRKRPKSVDYSKFYVPPDQRHRKEQMFQMKRYKLLYRPNALGKHQIFNQELNSQPKICISFSRAARKKALDDLIEENTAKVKSQKLKLNDGPLRERIQAFLKELKKFNEQNQLQHTNQYTFVN